MKILRLQMPRTFVHKMGLKKMFEGVLNVEIIVAYQYDQKNFFSMQRIVFEDGLLPKSEEEVKNFMEKKFNVIDFELIERSKNSILATMKQRRNEGFWIMFDPGPWAFLFPITVNPEYILLTIIGTEESIDDLKEALEDITDDEHQYEIIAQTTKKSIDQIGMQNVPFPSFTRRQQEISEYAARNGYFESPKKISAKKIAKYFSISESAVNENLRKAQQIAMKYFFGEKLN